MSMTGKETGQGWRLDKHIPLALIATIIVQTAAIVWWASGIDIRVDHLEQKQMEQNVIPERITRVETEINSMRGDLKRIDNKLDRLIEKR